MILNDLMAHKLSCFLIGVSLNDTFDSSLYGGRLGSNVKHLFQLLKANTNKIN